MQRPRPLPTSAVTAARLLSILLFAASVPAQAAQPDFRSAAENAVVLYDAPSTKAKKVYIVNRGYPLESVVTMEGWVKVRDAAGTLSWVESKSLAPRRTVMVKVANAPILETADDKSAVVFRAQQNVILDVVDADTAGWLRVRHPDGTSGFIRAAQVWGA